MYTRIGKNTHLLHPRLEDSHTRDPHRLLGLGEGVDNVLHKHGNNLADLWDDVVLLHAMLRLTANMSDNNLNNNKKDATTYWRRYFHDSDSDSM